MKAILEFLTELNENNNREWFNANRDRYESCRDKMLLMTEIFISEIRKFDGDIPVMDPRECLFRIYRDIRFSADKSPYKTHFGSFIARGGHKSTRAGYYFHVQPDDSFLSGGIYMPQPDVLKALRTGISDHSEELLSIINNPGFKKYFSTLEGEKLKTPPKGFSADCQCIELLKHKSYFIWTSLSTDDLCREDFIGKGIAIFREIYPLNRFLNETLEQYL
jgi:uncharacterized protein (TIGR02453 family)